MLGTFSSAPKLGARSTSAIIGDFYCVYVHPAVGAGQLETWIVLLYDAAVVTVVCLQGTSQRKRNTKGGELRHGEAEIWG